MAETVLLLVNYGADVTALNINLSTPLHLASSHTVPEAIRILIEQGADVNAQNETNLTPLHRVSSWVSIKTIHHLDPSQD